MATPGFSELHQEPRLAEKTAAIKMYSKALKKLMRGKEN